MQKQSLFKNYVYQFLYQGLIFLIPLVLSPYLTRTLRESSLGVYSYANSIAYYFVIFGMLGISRHGQRTISVNSNDEYKLRKAFWSLYAVHITISVITTLLYLLFVILYVRDDKAVFFIETLYVFSAIFDITWLYYGLENFKIIVIRNTVIKVIECALIFLLIKTPNDLVLYTFIVAGGTLLGHLVIIPQTVSKIKPVRVSFSECKDHIKPLLLFSIAVIASSLYVVFDKTLLGLMTIKENVAFYEYSNRIVNLPKTIVAVIGTVMFPRACRFAAEGKIDLQKKYIHYSVLITAFIGFGSMFGIQAISDMLSVVYYGESFRICGSIMAILAPLIFIVGLGDIIRTQYMIPNKLDKQFNFCIVLNAIINLILSVMLIPRIGIYGVVVGTLSAELFGLTYQSFICRKNISVVSIIKDSLPFAIIGFIMFIVLMVLKVNFTYGVKSLLTLILVGILVYFILCFLYIQLWKKDIYIAMKNILIRQCKNQ